MESRPTAHKMYTILGMTKQITWRIRARCLNGTVDFQWQVPVVHRSYFQSNAQKSSEITKRNNFINYAVNHEINHGFDSCISLEKLVV